PVSLSCTVLVLYSYDPLFTPPAPTDTYTLSLHDALPIWRAAVRWRAWRGFWRPLLRRARLRCWRGDRLRGWSPHLPRPGFSPTQDRKSTRLNSSHGSISYAVFCLKKKTKDITNAPDDSRA